jgi:hypothetical protein
MGSLASAGGRGTSLESGLPIRAMDLRDSLRQLMATNGVRQVDGARFPRDTAYGVHTTAVKWCLDSAVVWLVSSWQRGRPFDWVNLLVAAVPDADCSPDAFQRQRLASKIEQRLRHVRRISPESSQP